MNLGDAKLVYAFSIVVLSLLILSPTFAMIIPLPSGEAFSELWLLGPSRMLEGYPYNVSSGKLYRVYLGVGNHMDKLSYYKIYVKLRTESEPLPNSTAKSPSPLKPIFEYDVFLGNNETWEEALMFSFEDVSFDNDLCHISKMTIDNQLVDVDKTALRNETSNAFSFQLFFELWLYDEASSSFQYHNRWVGFRFNMSKTL